MTAYLHLFTNQAGSLRAIFFSRNEFILLSLDNLFQMVTGERDAGNKDKMREDDRCGKTA